MSHTPIESLEANLISYPKKSYKQLKLPGWKTKTRTRTNSGGLARAKKPPHPQAHR